MLDINQLTWEHSGPVLLRVDELKAAAEKMDPCPFCGGQPELIALKSDLPDFNSSIALDYIATCTKPGCCGCLAKRWSSIAIAVSKWNERVSKQTPEEPEFTKEQLKQIDNVENAAYDLACALCKDDDLEWDMEHIGEIADAAEAILSGLGFTTYYPAMTTDDDGHTIIVDS